MININPIYSTTIIQKIALYCSSYYGNDLYYLKEAVSILINIYGEKRLVKMLKEDNSENKERLNRIGENWYSPKGMKNKFQKISKILEKINKSYNILSDKTLKKEQKENINFDSFHKFCKEFPKIELDIYALFIFLIDHSSIRQMNISPQFLKILENEKKSFGGVENRRLN